MSMKWTFYLMTSKIFLLLKYYSALLKSGISKVNLRKIPVLLPRTVSSQSCFFDSHAGVPKRWAVLEGLKPAVAAPELRKPKGANEDEIL